MARGPGARRTALPTVVAGRVPRSRELLATDEIFRLPDGAVVSVLPPERVSPGPLRFGLSRQWRRRSPPKGHYEISADGSILKLRLVAEGSFTSRAAGFRLEDIKSTGRFADRCDDCGATSFETLREGDHDRTCARP
jgi:hypothetical protein